MCASEQSDLAARIASVGIWYHTVELAQGVVTPGLYDMRPHVARYRFPESLAGLSVLDVGASNGFFSFWFERAGARRVVATDLRTMADHDYPRWWRERELDRRTAEELQRIDHNQLHGGFEIAAEVLGSKVERRCAVVYDLPAVVDEQFDVVLCSNVLVHLRDPVLALEALRDVTAPGGLLVVASIFDTTVPDGRYAVFGGDPERVMWWGPSPACLVRFCQLAGFEEVEWVGSFELKSVREPVLCDEVGVVHCRAPRTATGVAVDCPPVTG